MWIHSLSTVSLLVLDNIGNECDRYRNPVPLERGATPDSSSRTLASGVLVVFVMVWFHFNTREGLKLR
jgi:hypothetical protein